MCRFLSLDFEHTLQCPVDKKAHTVRFQAYPQLRGHSLDVVECDAKPQVDQLSCGKACRGLLESIEYWQKIYPESATFAASQ
ncbi:MAG TPA: hypothetical protein VMR20_08515 [Verrucomicrobiae bacterium]|jgi:hypothetical protein|nr:hypothetical protein [Verrucomicrobiae bacterium]